ncbi:MAG: AF1514 family protein [Desulfobacterales bacterium]|nr:AF1514 family protein [Desulfobacterales bacterium]MDX2510522.1 AF1514 family protein [Desulfobacterales bacterium]
MASNELLGFTGNHIRLIINNPGLDLASATDIAKKKATELGDDPMLLAWSNGKTGEYYPTADCGSSDTPPWLVFAESRGADIAININDGEYIFLYLSF